MSLTVIGAGAFGTALSIAWGESGKDILLWGRDAVVMETADTNRRLPRLPDAKLPESIKCISDLSTALRSETIVLAVPAQQLRPFLVEHAGDLRGKSLIACCKGIDLDTMRGPVSSMMDVAPNSTAAMLTGPSFAADIANGMPTALTLACADDQAGNRLQLDLSTNTLRIYRTTDTVGAELGGALKNVMAIACGIAIGAGLGDSARAALMTRGFAEMALLAERLGAERETLMGLSGFGDLVLTCTSHQSRNFRYGVALGAREKLDTSVTIEGVATAKSVVKLARSLALELPICTVVGHLIDHKIDVAGAVQALMARPLKEE